MKRRCTKGRGGISEFCSDETGTNLFRLPTTHATLRNCRYLYRFLIQVCVCVCGVKRSALHYSDERDLSACNTLLKAAWRHGVMWIIVIWHLGEIISTIPADKLVRCQLRVCLVHVVPGHVQLSSFVWVFLFLLLRCLFSATARINLLFLASTLLFFTAYLHGRCVFSCLFLANSNWRISNKRLTFVLILFCNNKLRFCDSLFRFETRRSTFRFIYRFSWEIHAIGAQLSRR